MREPFCCPSRCAHSCCSFLLLIPADKQRSSHSSRFLHVSLTSFPLHFLLARRLLIFIFLVHKKIVIISPKLHLNLTCSRLPFLLHPGLCKGAWSQSDHRYTESSSLFIKNTVWFINRWCELSFKKLTPLQYDFLMHCFHKTK